MLKFTVHTIKRVERDKRIFKIFIFLVKIILLKSVKAAHTRSFQYRWMMTKITKKKNKKKKKNREKNASVFCICMYINIESLIEIFEWKSGKERENDNRFRAAVRCGSQIFFFLIFGGPTIFFFFVRKGKTLVWCIRDWCSLHNTVRMCVWLNH
jgi:hypothetical protein